VKFFRRVKIKLHDVPKYERMRNMFKNALCFDILLAKTIRE
jgi:hypothetical protein